MKQAAGDRAAPQAAGLVGSATRERPNELQRPGNRVLAERLDVDPPGRRPVQQPREVPAGLGERRVGVVSAGGRDPEPEPPASAASSGGGKRLQGRWGVRLLAHG